MLDIDIKGTQRIFENMPGLVNFVFVCPPSMKSLEKRLRGRGTEREEQIQTRLGNATEEIETALNNKDMVQYRIINDDLDQASEQFINLVEQIYSQEL